jgi:lysophospholipase L1-like esterase
MSRCLGWSAWALTAVILWGSVAQGAGRRAPPPGSRYVSMGSSFAAGPLVGTPADTPPDRCRRSIDNFAHQLARKRRLDLIDVSCSGATTANVLAPWSELPAQIDAVTSDTRLVTITIGGNDVQYTGNLMRAACAFARADDGKPRVCPPTPVVPEAAYAKVAAAMREIVAAVRARAPQARLIFVDYLTVLPQDGVCALTPMSNADAAVSRTVAARLAALTRDVAVETGAETVRASKISRGHDACSIHPWVSGFADLRSARTAAPYHPNGVGMAALANALDRQLGR